MDPNATLTGKRLRVVSNKADVTAGIDNEGTSRLSRVVFSKNQTTDCCSGFYNESGGTAKLTNVTFDRNTAARRHGGDVLERHQSDAQERHVQPQLLGSFCGGALISANGTLNLTNVTFSDNRANDDGGALFTQLSSITNLNDVTFTGNVADADDDGGGDGGGLYNSGGSINVQNTILARNIDRGGEAPDCGENLGGNRLRVRRSQPDRLDDRLPLPGTRQRHLPGRESAPRPPCAQWRLHPDRRPTQAQQGDQPRLREAARDRRSACAKRDQRGVKRPQGPRCDIGAFERKHPRHH